MLAAQHEVVAAAFAQDADGCVQLSQGGYTGDQIGDGSGLFAAAGIETRSIDEMTGVQALERSAASLHCSEALVRLVADACGNETLAKPFRRTYTGKPLAA